MSSTKSRTICFPSWVVTGSCICLFYGSSLYGKDFGIKGELFHVAEENLITVLQKKISEKSSIQILESALQTLRNKVQNPQSPLVPPEAKTYKMHYYDPTFVTKESITDIHGSIIVAKGTKINPLKSTKLSTGLLFFDGNDSAHLKWARSQQGSFKWVLIHGNPFQLEEQENRPVYFDQQGFSVSKFNIQHIPARVTQDGLRLKIEEMPPTHKEDPS